jgi:hypothetical protein
MEYTPGPLANSVVLDDLGDGNDTISTGSSASPDDLDTS